MKLLELVDVDFCFKDKFFPCFEFLYYGQGGGGRSSSPLKLKESVTNKHATARI